MTAKKININEAAEMLKAHDNYTILTHSSPDGDTVGCGYGLCRALRKIGKKANVVCGDEISKHFSFMWEGVEPMEFQEETVISVDVADYRLMNGLEEAYRNKVLLSIDHHVSHVDFAQYLCLEPDVAACCQTVYKIIKAMGIGLDKGIAACLYTGIATDSGCFKFSSVTPETHRIAADLLEYDFGFANINYQLFDLKSRELIALEEKIYREMEFYLDGKCAAVFLTKAVLDSIDSEDANQINGIPRRIEGVEVGVVVKEKKKCVWKASLRANNTVDVQKIASAFGGGGHKNASGCTFEVDNPQKVMELLVPEIEKALK